LPWTFFNEIRLVAPCDKYVQTFLKIAERILRVYLLPATFACRLFEGTVSAVAAGL
jgi:hypothetical protein